MENKFSDLQVGDVSGTTGMPVERCSDVSDSEIVIGLVGTVGTSMDGVVESLIDRFKKAKYFVQEIKVSRDIIPLIVPVRTTEEIESRRIVTLMDAGNEARSKSGDNAILAAGVSKHIKNKRPHVKEFQPRRGYIVNSLKHPEEVLRLRQIYPNGFFLIGVHIDDDLRAAYFRKKNFNQDEIDKLMERDKNEHLPYGQKVNETFHMSDFFVRLKNNDNVEQDNSLDRIVDIMFGDPYKTPTFDEYAMFLAFAASLRSADLSRQVGAVLAKEDEILSTGANDCPKYGGGLYWPVLDPSEHKISDKKDGRDYMRGMDSNKTEQLRIIEDIIKTIKPICDEEEKLRAILLSSRIKDLTEYGRVVHAEMEAILCCARNNVSTRGATLYCTTFPCHNCAKHIVAAGLKRVVFIEPYQKSKALDFHKDSIGVGFMEEHDVVAFQPFVGVGPRRFFDLFSIRLGAGYELSRKQDDGSVWSWCLSQESKLRIQMVPHSYLDLELCAADKFDSQVELLKEPLRDQK